MTKSDHTEKVTGQRSVWSRLLLVAGVVLILVGVAPTLLLIWDGSRNYYPLSMPLTLARGQTTSPWFTPDVNDTWQIFLFWPHFILGPQVDPDKPDARARPIPLSIDWKIVDDRDALIAQGTFADGLMGGNEVHLGSYTTRRGVRQRIILDVHTDVQGENDAHPTLKIEDSGPALDDSYAFPVFLGWAAIFGGSGLIVLLIGLLKRAPQI